MTRATEGNFKLGVTAYIWRKTAVRDMTKVGVSEGGGRSEPVSLYAMIMGTAVTTAILTQLVKTSVVIGTHTRVLTAGLMMRVMPSVRAIAGLETVQVKRAMRP
jgi:hypothetical protein